MQKCVHIREWESPLRGATSEYLRRGTWRADVSSTPTRCEHRPMSEIFPRLPNQQNTT